MIIVDEYDHQIIFQLSSEQLIEILQELKNSKEKEIHVVKSKIKKFEEQRRAHEVWYQSLSPLRKLFAGRPPLHHQAVEYLVNVKERFQQIEHIKEGISEMDRIIQLLQREPETAEITLPNALMNELKKWKMRGEREQ